MPSPPAGGASPPTGLGTALWRGTEALLGRTGGSTTGVWGRRGSPSDVCDGMLWIGAWPLLTGCHPVW
ncbi:MAG TPA: hypothetical protein PLA46_10355, partial [Phycicoccus sp.]|nr:hypothetical protein [Phycicoccus sp.]